MFGRKPVAGPATEFPETRERGHARAVFGHQHRIAGTDAGLPPRGSFLEGRGLVDVYGRGRRNDVVEDRQYTGHVAFARVTNHHRMWIVTRRQHRVSANAPTVTTAKCGESALAWTR